MSENRIKTEFESFYYHILKYTKDLDQNIQDQLKSKIRRTCENYSQLKIPYRYRKIVENLSKNNNIVVMKQDKGRGVVILDRTRYTEKCYNIINTNQFVKLDNDPTKTIESKVQRTLRKIKDKMTESEYKKLYPTGSRPGQFYGTAKIHKLKPGQGVDDLTLRPIISNLGTATYETAKYLTALLTPLSKSENTILNTADFIKRIRKKTIPNGFKMVSFDVKNLFTNVPLDKTIEIILKKVYDEKVIKTTIHKPIMKELLYLCTKHVHFMFNGEIYIQCDGVAMGSPLGPLLANIFMIALEEQTLPLLKKDIANWKRYVDDTHAYINPDKIGHILKILNSYHPKIQFTYELEDNNTISFLDVLVKRTQNNKFETSVYRKPTNTDIYMNWNTHAPTNWKIGTLKTLIKRAKTVCSNETLLKREIEHLRKVFVEINNYPKNMVNRIIKQQLSNTFETVRENDQTKEPTETVQLIVPYTGKQGNKILSKMKKNLSKALPDKVKTMITYQGTKLSTKFNIKDQTKFHH